MDVWRRGGTPQVGLAEVPGPFLVRSSSFMEQRLIETTRETVPAPGEVQRGSSQKTLMRLFGAQQGR